MNRNDSATFRKSTLMMALMIGAGMSLTMVSAVITFGMSILRQI